MMVEQEFQKSLSKQSMKLKGGALEDALSRTSRVWRINEEGVPEAYEGRSKMYGEKGTPISMEEFVLKLNREAGHLFEGAKGGGATGNDGTSVDHNGVRIISRAQADDYIEELATGKARFAE